MASLWPGGRGRVGSCGGVSASDSGLLGGLVNGDTSVGTPARFWLPTCDIDEIEGAKLGLVEESGSAGGFESRSRLMSKDRRGGGGDGGLGECALDDLAECMPFPIGDGDSGRLPTLRGEGDRGAGK